MNQINQYKITSKLGGGGMGEVYKAQDTLLERDVAIKVMHRHLMDDERNAKRFLREAQAAAKLVHPNIVTIYEVGMADVGRYIVMEFLEGASLTQLLAQEAPFSVERAAKLTKQVLAGLKCAHDMGVLHRDIKADNILVGPNDWVKILDFGIAKVMNKEGLTIAGDILGTVEYMSPEQMLGNPVDFRSDLYSVGVVLYQMLTGRLPFTGDSPVAIVYKQLNEDPVPPSYYNPRLDRRVDALVLKAINHTLEERWDTADQFAAAIDDLFVEVETEIPLVPVAEGLTEEEWEAPQGNTKEEAGELRAVFVGRKKEFRELVGYFSSATRGEGKTVIVQGEAGVGKSTLAARLKRYAEHNKAWVLQGACLYQEGLDSYLPFIDALRGFFSTESHSLPTEERDRIKDLVRERVPLLLEFTERFNTSFAQPSQPPEAGSEAPSANLLEGIHLLLTVLSQIRPTVLIVDDLQWADDATLRLFHYLSHRITNNRVLLLGLCRSDRYDLQQEGKPAPIVDVLARMGREGIVEQIELDRLSEDESELLVDGALSSSVLSEEFYESVFAETKGNPFFVLEALKMLRNSGGITFEEGAWTDHKEGLHIEVPDRVEDVFIRRLSTLPDDDRENLQVAAVLGYKFDGALLSRLLELPKIKLLRFLQRIERDLEIVAGTDDGFQFEHPLLRDLLYNEIPAELRKEFHLMAAAELEKDHPGELGALVGEVARHLMRGGNHERAIPLLSQAALRAFDLSAYGEAGRFFEGLLDSVEKSGQPIPEGITEYQVYEKLGNCYEETGYWDRGLEAYEKARQIGQNANDWAGQVGVLKHIGRVHDKQGDFDSALKSYEQCIDILKEHPLPNVLSHFYNNIGIVHYEKGEFDHALGFFDKTLQAVAEEPDEHDHAHALTNIGIISSIREDFMSARESYEKALAIYEELGDRKSLARVYHNLGMTYADEKDWAKSIEAFEQCYKLADDVEDKQLRAMTHLNMGKAYARQENLVKAKEHAEKALKVFKRMGDILNEAEAFHVFGLVYGLRGNMPEAERYFQESIRINREKDYHEGLADTLLSFANTYRANEQAEKARDCYHKAADAFTKLELGHKAAEVMRMIEQMDAGGEDDLGFEHLDLDQKTRTRDDVSDSSRN